MRRVGNWASLKIRDSSNCLTHLIPQQSMAKRFVQLLLVVSSIAETHCGGALLVE